MVTKGEYERIRDILIDELYDGHATPVREDIHTLVHKIMYRITEGGHLLSNDSLLERIMRIEHELYDLRKDHA